MLIWKPSEYLFKSHKRHAFFYVTLSLIILSPNSLALSTKQQDKLQIFNLTKLLDKRETPLITCDVTGVNCVKVNLVTVPEHQDGCRQFRSCDRIEAAISNDSQKTWKKTLENFPFHRELHVLHAIHCSKDMKYCVAVGGTGDGHDRMEPIDLIVSSQDGGYHWQANAIGNNSCDNSFFHQVLTTVASDPTGQKWAAMGGCSVFYPPGFYKSQSLFSDNGGVSWRQATTPAEVDSLCYSINSVKCDDRECYAYGTAQFDDCIDGKKVPLVFVSKDFGDNWQRVQPK